MKYELDWPEMSALLFLIIGFVGALFSGKAMVLYVVAFLMGLLFGRLWYKNRKGEAVPAFLVIMGFFLGFLLGGFYANLQIIALLLFSGLLIGYWLHKKKIIRTI